MKTKLGKRVGNRGSVKGYLILGMIVVSLIAMAFGTFIPLVASAALILIFVGAKKFNITLSKKTLGFFALFLIVGGLVAFAGVSMMHGFTGKSVNEPGIVDEPLTSSTPSTPVETPSANTPSNSIQPSLPLAKSVSIVDDKGSSVAATISSNSDTKTLDVVPQDSVIKKIEFNDLIDNGNNQLKISRSFSSLSVQSESATLPFENPVQIYAIDPSTLNFTNATVTVQAKGNELYKCKSWDFATQECSDGAWTLIKSDLTPGQDYEITLTADDPGFIEILATDAQHLNSTRGFISDIYTAIQARDDNWSEDIPSGDYVRVYYATNLTSAGDIDVYPLIVSGNPSIEVYEKDSDILLANYTNIANNESNSISLSNLTDQQDIFDLRIVGGTLKLDYILDPVAQPGGNVILMAQTCKKENAAAQNSYSSACNGTYPGVCGSGTGNDRISCNDNFLETATFKNGNYGGINISVFNNTINDCGSIQSVYACYDWFSSTTTSLTGCLIAADSDGGASYSTVTTTCPGSSGTLTCTNVTALENWSCSDFFGPSGTRAALKSEISRSIGSSTYVLSMDALFFNVTYASIPPPSISITDPASTTYTENISSLNYTVSGAQSCWYSLNGGVTNVSVTCGTNLTGLTSNEGSNTWTVWANNSAGIQNSSSVTFLKYTAPSVVSLVSPQDGYTELNSPNINFIYNVSSNYSITSCTLYTQDFEGYKTYYPNQTNIAPNVNQTINATFQNYGDYTWGVECVDQYGNFNTGPTNHISVDVLSIQQLVTTNLTYYLHNESDSQYTSYRQMKNVSTELSSVPSGTITISNAATTCWNVSWIAPNWTAQTDVSGNWTFNIYTNCSNTLTTYLRAKILKRNSTGEFNPQNASGGSFSCRTGAATAKTWSYNVSNLTINPGERVGIQICTNSTSGTPRTTSMFWENTTSSSVRFPTLQIIPSVSLVSPTNGSVSGNNDVNFVCNVSSLNSLSNMTFYWNYSGNWLANTTTSITGSSNSTTFSQTNLNNGAILWNCQACNSSNYCVSGSNYTVNVNYSNTGGIKYDNNASAQNAGGTGVTLNFPFTVNNFKNGILVVGSGGEDSDTTNALSCNTLNITYGGTPLTKIYEQGVNTSGGATDCASLWYLLNPPVGTANVLITFNTTSTFTETDGGAISIYNAVQKAPEAFNSSFVVTAANPAVIQTSITTLTDNTFLIDAAVSGNLGAMTPGGANQTKIYDVGNNTAELTGSTKTTNNPGVYSMNWSQAIAGLRLAQVIAAFTSFDLTSPNATLVSPSNGNTSSSSTVNFTCNATDNRALANITFYWNYSGSWQNNGTTAITGTANSTVFQKTGLQNGAVLWSCYACDNSSNCAFASSNNSVTVASDTTPPVISLLNPANGITNTNGFIRFYYNATDPDDNVSSCTLVLNNTANANSSSITSGIQQELDAQNLAQGNYTWKINCTDTHGNQNSSASRNITVQFPPNATNGTIILNQTMVNAQGTALNATITLVETGTGQTDYNTSNGQSTNISSGTYNIQVVFPSGNIQNVTFYGVNVTGNITSLMNLDNSTSSQFKTIYGVSPTIAYNYSSINLTVSAQGRTLFKCANWNFTNQSCIDGIWKKIGRITSGQNYTITMQNSSDPGFGESNSTLNVLDYQNTLINSNQSILSNQSNVYNVQVNLTDNAKVTQVNVYAYNDSTVLNDLKVQEGVNVTPGYASTYSIDTSNLSNANITVTVIASEEALYKCANWSFSTQSCLDNTWTVFKTGLAVGQPYTFTLLPGDPGFAGALNTTYYLHNETDTQYSAYQQMKNVSTDLAQITSAGLSMNTAGVQCWANKWIAPNSTLLNAVNGTWNFTIYFSRTTGGGAAPVATLFGRILKLNSTGSEISITNSTASGNVGGLTTPTAVSWTYSLPSSNLTNISSGERFGVQICMNVTTVRPRTATIYWENTTPSNIQVPIAPFITSPVVHLIIPANNTFTNISSQTFSCNITSTAIANLTLNIWNSTGALNYTNTTVLTGTTTNSTNWTFSLPKDDVYKWNCLGKNTLGDQNYSAEGNYTITLDTVKPFINFTSPTLSSGSSTTDGIIVNVTASDSGAGLKNITINLYNSTGSLINSTNSTSSPLYINFSVSSDGTYFFNSTAYDNAGNKNSTSTSNVTIDTLNPAIQFVSPTEISGTTLFNRSNILVNVTVTDANFKNVTINLYNSTGLVNSTTSTSTNLLLNFTNLPSAQYFFNSTAIDLAGNSNSTETRNVTVNYDITPPAITITYPQNISYNTNVSQLNYTVSDLNLQSCWYSTNLGVTNISIACGTNKSGLTSGEGSNTWRVYANDTAGNQNFSSVTFFKDTINPQIQIVPPSETAGSFKTVRNVIVNVTANDTNLKNVTIFLYNSTGSLINSTNSTSSPLYINFSVGADGTYYFNATAYDTTGNTNNTETRNVTIDTQNPQIQFVNPTDTSGTFLSRSNIIVNVTAFNANLANITIRLYNSTGLINSTTTTASPNFINFTGLSDGQYFFNATAVDLAGNTNSTETRNVTIDTQNPQIQFVNPTDASGSLKTVRNIIINLTASDSGAGLKNITINLYNSTGSLINSSNSTTSPLFVNFSVGADGQYFFNSTAYDNAGNKNSTSTSNVTIDTLNPAIQFVSPTEISGTTLFNRSNILVNVTVTDANFKNVTINLYNSTGLVNSTTSTSTNLLLNFTNLPSAQYFFNSTAIDLAGNSNSTETRNVTVNYDITPPAITITYPQNISYNTNVSQLNYTVSDLNLQSCWYSTNLGVTNISIACGTNKSGLTSGEGSNTWRVYANDTAGNQNFSSVTFFKDTINPQIQIVPPSETAGSFKTVRNVIVNVTANDTNLKNVTIFLYNSTGSLINSTNSTSSPLYINFSVGADGTYYFNATAYDTTGNTNNTETRNVTIDTQNPQIQFVNPTDTSGTFLSRSNIIVNVTAFNANLANITIRLYNSTGLINSTTTTASPNFINFTGLSDGQYFFNATAVDLAGNTNSTETRNVTIDTQNPQIQFVNPTDNSGSFLSRNNLLINVTAFNTNLANITIRVYNSTGLVNSTTTAVSPNFINITLPNGQYFFNATALDLAGNQNSTETRNVTVDTIKPQISIISPLNQSYNTRQILVNLSISDTNPQAMWYNWNGTNITYSGAVFVNFSEGNNTLTAYANDSAGNVNSTSVLFRADTTAPTVHLITQANNTLTNVSSQTFSCNISNVAVSNITLLIWNSTGSLNYSNTTALTGISNSTSWAFSLPKDDVYKWNCLGLDYVGNSNYSAEGNYTITLDTAKPLVQFVSPTTQTGNFSQSFIEANVSASDLHLDTVVVSLYNFTGLINRTSSNGSIYLNYSLQDGLYYLNATANDSAGNINFTETRSIILDTVKPSIILNSPTNKTYNNKTVLVNISASNGLSGIQAIWFNWNGTNISYSAPVNVTFAEGQNILTAYANDSAGNINQTSVTFSSDTTPPSISIVSPANQTYNNRTVLVNISASDVNLQSRWFNWNGTNISYSAPINFTFAEGSNTLTAYANDSLGNLNSTSVTFLVDSTPPLIQFGNGTEVNGTTVNTRNNLLVNVTSSDIHFANMTVNLYQAGVLINSTKSNSSSLLLNFTTLVDDTYSFNATAYDTAGNFNSTETRTVTITFDVIPPFVAIAYPQNTAYNVNVSQLNYTAADNHLSSCWYSTDVGVTNISIACGTNATGLTSNEGNNTWRVYANDTFGNQNSTSVAFLKDTILPLISIVSPANQTYNTRQVLVNLSATDANLRSIWYNWNGTNITYSGAVFVNFSEGNNTLTAYANDSAGNVNSTSVIFATDTIPPYVAITAPQNETYNNATQYVNIANDGNNVWFNWNGTNITYINPIYATFNEGPNTLFAYANDSAGNENSTNVTFTIDTIAPTIGNVSSKVILNATAVINWTTDELANSTVMYGTSPASLTSSNSSSNNVTSHEITLNLLSANTTYFYNVTSCDLYGNCRTSGVFNFTTHPSDVEAPNFTFEEILPRDVATGNSVLLNATAVDNVAVDAIIANVTLPNGTSVIVNVPSLFTAPIVGRYSVVFIANDTSGNKVTVSDIFEAGSSMVAVQFNAIKSDLSGLPVNLTIYLTGTNATVNESSFSGISSESLANILYDLFFKAFNGNITVRLNGVSIASNVNETIGLDENNNVSGYLKTYGVNNTYNLTNANVKISYAGLNYSNENNLRVDVCEGWDFVNRNCSSTWTALSATQNTTDKTFSFTVTNFSAFSIKELITPPTPAGGGGGAAYVPSIISKITGCQENWQCSPWSDCQDFSQVRSCTDLNGCGTTANKPAETASCNLPSHCADGVLNDGESDVDCGGSVCDLCSDGKACIHNSDCSSDICSDNVCKPSVQLPAAEAMKRQFWWVFILIALIVGIIIYSGASRVLYTLHLPSVQRKIDEGIEGSKSDIVLTVRKGERRMERTEKRFGDSFGRMMNRMKNAFSSGMIGVKESSMAVIAVPRKISNAERRLGNRISESVGSVTSGTRRDLRRENNKLTEVMERGVGSAESIVPGVGRDVRKERRVIIGKEKEVQSEFMLAAKRIDRDIVSALMIIPNAFKKLGRNEAKLAENAEELILSKEKAVKRGFRSAERDVAESLIKTKRVIIKDGREIKDATISEGRSLMKGAGKLFTLPSRREVQLREKPEAIREIKTKEMPIPLMPSIEKKTVTQKLKSALAIAPKEKGLEHRISEGITAEERAVGRRIRSAEESFKNSLIKTRKVIIKDGREVGEAIRSKISAAEKSLKREGRDLRKAFERPENITFVQPMIRVQEKERMMVKKHPEKEEKTKNVPQPSGFKPEFKPRYTTIEGIRVKEHAVEVPKEEPSIRLNIPENISNTVSITKESVKRGLIQRMLDNNIFKKDLMKYLHKQNPSELGVQVERKEKVVFPHRAVMESISQRKEVADRMKLETTNRVPIKETRLFKALMKPFVHEYQESKPEDFTAIYEKEKMLEKRNVKEKPKESKVMGMAIKIEERLPRKQVGMLMEETSSDSLKNNKFIKQQEKRVARNIRRHEMEGQEQRVLGNIQKHEVEEQEERVLENIEKHEVEEQEERVLENIEEHEKKSFVEGKMGKKEKGLLNQNSSQPQSKHQSVKKYMLDGLKDAYY